MHAPFHRGSLLVGLIWGLVVGVTPFFQELAASARWTLSLGLGLSYASIGLLVAVLPDFGSGRRWLIGGVAGLLYSVPGAVFTMVPYPLRDDAPRYWREFANGGWRAFVLTLGFGAVVGVTCGLARRRAA